MAEIEKMRALPHLDPVADQLEGLALVLEDEAERVKAGEIPAARAMSHHMFLSGPPGTGKSWAADTVAKMLRQMGVSKTDKVIKTSAEKLVGSFQGEAETNMVNALEAAKGGVLFIDEAHRLAETKYGRNALGALIAPMADPNFDTTVVFAGYSMAPLLQADPGLRSRVKNDIRFKAMSGDQMSDYAAQVLGSKQWNMSHFNKKAKEAMWDAIDEIAARVDDKGRPTHASMRDVNTLLEFANEAKTKRNARNPKKNTPKARSLLTAADFQAALKKFEATQAAHDEIGSTGFDSGVEM